MNATRNFFEGSRFALCALSCGLAAVATGCGDAAESSHAEQGRDLRDVPADIAAKYPVAWSLVQSFLRAERDLQGRTVKTVTELYRPDVEGAAYLEFALHDGASDAGYVIASTGAHDFPIMAWSSRGTSAAQSLERQHQRDLGGARIFMTGPGAFVAEVSDGSVVSSGSSLKPEAWSLAKSEFVRARAARKLESTERAVQAWQRVAAESPTCASGAEDLVRGADIMGPPNYTQFYGSFDNGSCKVGCVPTAFAQIAGWLSHQAGDHRDGSVWGHPRVAYAFDGSEDIWGPVAYDANVAGVAVEFRNRFATYCSGDSGMTTYFPYDRISDLGGRLFNQIGAPVNTYGLYNAGWDAYAAAIDNALTQARTPVEINAMTDPWGNSAHAWIVWGYRNDCFGEAYRVNMGWDSHEAGEWVSKGSVLGALTSGFTHGLDGSGIVTFAPQALSRDYGPITTAGGSGYCLDVADASTDSGAIVSQFGCHGGDNQLWYLDRTETTAAGWQIRNRNSGQCLAPAGGGAFNGAQILQTTCDKADANGLWKIEKHGAVVALKHVPSGRCLDLDDSGGVTGDNRKIQTWDCNGAPHQLFDFAR